MPYELITLTPEQQAVVFQYYETEDIGKIARRIFGEKSADGKPITGKTTEGKSVKACIANAGKVARVVETHVIPLALTDDQKTMIEELGPRTSNSLELTRIVFSNQNLASLSREARAVREHMKLVYPEGLDMSEDPVEERLYKIPTSLPSLVGLVNTFVQQYDNKKTYNLTGIKPFEDKCLKALMVYIRRFRFGMIASSYTKQVDRELFLSTFINWTHDKPDLTKIEQDQMMSGAEETVNIAQIGRSIQRIDQMHEQIVAGEILDDNGKKIKLGTAEEELINGYRTKHDAAKKRLEANMKTLETARSERLKDQSDRYTSVITLLDPWMKDKERRDIWIASGKEEKAEDAAEVERLSGVEDFLALISGQTKEEAMR